MGHVDRWCRCRGPSSPAPIPHPRQRRGVDRPDRVLGLADAPTGRLGRTASDLAGPTGGAGAGRPRHARGVRAGDMGARSRLPGAGARYQRAPPPRLGASVLERVTRDRSDVGTGRRGRRIQGHRLDRRPSATDGRRHVRDVPASARDPRDRSAPRAPRVTGPAGWRRGPAGRSVPRVRVVDRLALVTGPQPHRRRPDADEPARSSLRSLPRWGPVTRGWPTPSMPGSPAPHQGSPRRRQDDPPQRPRTPGHERRARGAQRAGHVRVVRLPPDPRGRRLVPFQPARRPRRPRLPCRLRRSRARRQRPPTRRRRLTVAGPIARARRWSPRYSSTTSR